MEKVYDINIKNDTDGIHSKTLCRKCYSRLKRLNGTGKTVETVETVRKDIERSSVLWVQYDTHVGAASCIVCSTFEKQTKGRRHNKLLDFKPITSPVCQSQQPDVSDLSGDAHVDASNVVTHRHESTSSTSMFLPPSTSTPLRPTPIVSSSESHPSTSCDSTVKPPKFTRDFGTNPCKKLTVRDIDQI